MKCIYCPRRTWFCSLFYPNFCDLMELASWQTSPRYNYLLQVWLQFQFRFNSRIKHTSYFCNVKRGTLTSKTKGNKMRVLLCFLFFAVVTLHLADSVSIERDLSMTFREKQILDKVKLRTQLNYVTWFNSINWTLCNFICPSQFRERLKPLLKEDYMKTDIYLVRWLRGMFRKLWLLNIFQLLILKN